MSVAAGNDWYHAERRVMSRRQRRIGRYKDGDHRVAGSNLLAGIIFFIIIFFCNLYNEKKNIFAIENVFTVFLKKEIV